MKQLISELWLGNETNTHSMGVGTQPGWILEINPHSPVGDFIGVLTLDLNPFCLQFVLSAGHAGILLDNILQLRGQR
jgi:hypothetical protein